MSRIRFKNLRQALRWQKLHPRRRVTGVTVTSNAPLKRPPKHNELDLAKKVVALAHAGLAFRGRMYYSMSSSRSSLFNRHIGNFAGASADCSQFCCAILHWLGVRKVNDTDYTGTLLQKGKHISSPKVGCVVIFGGGTGEHAAFVTEKVDGVWWTIGFGHQGAPDRVSLPAMEDYFRRAGHPGVTFLDFLD